MKLKSKYNDPAKLIDYKLDTKDGQFCQSQMPATVAEEIAQRATSIEVCEEKGFELVVNGDMMLPIDIFDIEEGEIEGRKPARKSGRPTKAELLEEAGKEMTNPQIHQAIENAKQEKAEKRGVKE